MALEGKLLCMALWRPYRLWDINMKCWWFARESGEPVLLAHIDNYINGGARGVKVIVVGIGHDDMRTINMPVV